MNEIIQQIIQMYSFYDFVFSGTFTKCWFETSLKASAEVQFINIWYTKSYFQGTLNESKNSHVSYFESIAKKLSKNIQLHT